jgi:uncharacterized membrane protein
LLWSEETAGMWIVFLHVAAMFIGIALTVGVGVYFVLIERSQDVRALRTATRAAIPLSIAGGIAIVVGAVFGLIAAVRDGYPLTAPWLAVTYVLLAFNVLDGFFEKMPHMRNVQRAADVSLDDHPSEELQRLCTRKIDAILGPVNGLFWLAIIAMMTLKP